MQSKPYSLRVLIERSNRSKMQTMEAPLTQQSSMHIHLNRPKERVDEMDAAWASLEAKVGEMQADSKACHEGLNACRPAPCLD
jgi:hypothetical protein